MKLGVVSESTRAFARSPRCLLLGSLDVSVYRPVGSRYTKCLWLPKLASFLGTVTPSASLILPFLSFRGSVRWELSGRRQSGSDTPPIGSIPRPHGVRHSLRGVDTCVYLLEEANLQPMGPFQGCVCLVVSLVQYEKMSTDYRTGSPNVKSTLFNRR